MAVTPLPVLISIPSSGLRIPEELKDRVVLSMADLLDDADAFGLDIYHLGSRVAQVHVAEVARSFVDLNRPPHEWPPQYPDGVIKSITRYGREIYAHGREPEPDLISRLVQLYYEPYHKQLQHALKQDSLVLALDCHAMPAVGPPIAPDVGQRRPLLCLGNVHGRSCPQSILERLAHCFGLAFAFQESDIALNQPFSGGYLTRIYGGNPIPWVHVAINQSLYLHPPWFERETLLIDNTRLQELNRQFTHALELFFAGR